MKRVLFVILACLALVRPAIAHAQGVPTLAELAGSDQIYLVKVIASALGPNSAQAPDLTLSVMEVLRGEPRSRMKLLPIYGGGQYKEGSEWLIFHNSSGFKNCVGWAVKGDCEWLPIGVEGEGDKAVIGRIGPVDKVRDYLREHPQK